MSQLFGIAGDLLSQMTVTQMVKEPLLNALYSFDVNLIMKAPYHRTVFQDRPDWSVSLIFVDDFLESLLFRKTKRGTLKDLQKC